MYINITGFQFSFVGTRYKRSNFDRIFPAKWCSHKIHQFCSNGIQNTNQVKYLYIYILFFVAFCSLFVLFLFAFVLSVLPFTDSEYPFGIFKSSYKIKQLDGLIDWLLLKVVPYTSGKIWSARLIFLFFGSVFEYIHCK